MPPWETEEFACIWGFLFERYGSILAEVFDNLTDEGQRPIWECDVEIPHESPLMESIDMSPRCKCIIAD